MERKNTKELLPVITAFAEGKQVQFFNDGVWNDVPYPSFNEESHLYRVKPEPRYRPFNTIKECWQEMQKHQPFGWIKCKKEEEYHNIVSIYQQSKDLKAIIDTCGYTFSELFDEFTFTDNSLFGIKEE